MSNHVYISLADADEHNGDSIDAEKFSRVHEVSWPLETANEQPRNLIIREKIAEIDVPEHLQDKNSFVVLKSLAMVTGRVIGLGKPSQSNATNDKDL